MLIPDLLNVLFDQSDYQSLVVLCLLNKRKTRYANKYSLLIHYHIFDNSCTKIMSQVCDNGELKTAKYVNNYKRYAYVFDAICTSAEYGYLEMLKYLINSNIYHDFSHLRMQIDYALLVASKHGNQAIVKYLVSIGANAKKAPIVTTYSDAEERRRFSQVSHEYLLDQLQFI